MDGKRRETVVVVHGTFARSSSDDTWYKPDSEFCAAVDEALEARSSSARCWAHLRDGQFSQRPNTYFEWDGKNLERSRAAASKDLLGYLRALRGWKVHVIAHSHGGNVAYQAINWERKVWSEAEIMYGEQDGIGALVCLGTPFLHVPKRVDQLSWLVGGAGRLAAIALVVFLGVVAPGYSIATVILTWSIVGLIVLAIGVRAFLLGIGSPPPRYRNVVAITSERDEAFVGLKQLAEGASPIPEPAGGLIFRQRARLVGTLTELNRSLDEMGGSTVLQDIEISGRARMVVTMVSWVIGGLLFGGALSHPFWYLTLVLLVAVPAALDDGSGTFTFLTPLLFGLSIVPRLILAMGATLIELPSRRFAWSTLRRVGLGYESNNAATDVTVTMAPAGFVEVRLLPDVTVERVQEAQRDWTALHGRGLHDFAADLPLVNDEVRLPPLEGLPLVHAVYYQDTEVAGWIADAIVDAADRENWSAPLSDRWWT